MAAMVQPSSVVASLYSATSLAIVFDNPNVSNGLGWIEKYADGAFVGYSGGNGVPIAGGRPETAGFLDTGVVDGVEYSYKVWLTDAANLLSPSPKTDSNAITLPLRPPTGVGVTQPNITTFLIAWTKGSDQATGYKIYLADGTLLVTINSTTTFAWAYVASGAPWAYETTFSFYVRAFNALALSAPSGTASITTPADPGGGGDTPTPNIPTQLVLSPLGTDRISATWLNNGPIVAWWEIMNVTTAATVVVYSAAYTWGGLTAATPYTFKVRACNGVYSGGAFGYSAWSAVAVATTGSGAVGPPDPCTNFAVHSHTDTTAVLTWMPPAGGVAETGYRIDQSVSGGEFTTAKTISIHGVGRAKLRGLLPDTLYAFKIYAINGAAPGYSTAAGPISVTTYPTKTTNAISPWPNKLVMAILEWELAHRVEGHVWTADAGCWYTDHNEGDVSRMAEHKSATSTTVLYTKAASVEDCRVKASTYFFDPLLNRLHVHPSDDLIPSTSHIILAYFFDLFTTHAPTIFNGREYSPLLQLASIPNISWGTGSYAKGETQLGFGSIKINNESGYFDTRLAHYIHEAKYMRLMRGEYTISALNRVVPNARSTFGVFWEGRSGSLTWSDTALDVETVDIRETVIASTVVGNVVW